MALRVNMGCGRKHMAGYLNLDIDPACDPDRVMDMTALPWDFADSSIEELQLIHVLEHVGQTPEGFRDIVREIHRVMRHEGKVHVMVPDPSHDTFMFDPTHVRPITPELFMMLSKRRNAEWLAGDMSCSPIAETWGVDFEVTRIDRELDPAFKTWAAANGIAIDGNAVRFYRNAVIQTYIEMKAVKPEVPDLRA